MVAAARQASTATRRASLAQMDSKQMERLRAAQAHRSLPKALHTHTESDKPKFECTRRDVQLLKPTKEDFGAYFTNIGGRVIVNFVSEYPLISGNTNLFSGYRQSAAFRAGLSIGSEIISINGDAVGEMEDYPLRVLLSDLTDVRLEIKDPALRTNHNVECKVGQTLGIQEYSDSEILRVRKGSPAAAAGIKPGYMIVSVAGRSTFGMADRAVLDLISTMVSTAEPFVIETINTFCGIRMLCDTWRVMEVLLPNVAPFEIIDADYQTTRLEIPYSPTANLMLSLFEHMGTSQAAAAEAEPAPAA